MVSNPCYQCGNAVSLKEHLEVRRKYSAWSHNTIVCLDCMKETDDGATEVECRQSQQAMIEQALHFISDYGAEAWNEIVQAVVEQAK